MSRIGVVGLAIRCAGANNESEFAKLLERGETGIRASEGKDVPASRFTTDRYVPFCAPIAGATLFDRGVFELSEVEAENMDPQHRQALEIALEAFESANIRPRSYDGSIGVFATSGNTLNSYGLSPFHVLDPLRDIPGGIAHLGNDSHVLAGRIAHSFDLKGPALGIQTACSSSLVAFHLACQALETSQCDVALVCASVVRSPEGMGYFVDADGIASPSGECHPLDESASGTVWGSAAVAVVLKRIENHSSDGTVRALVVGSAVNNDGHQKSSFASMSEEGIARCIAEAVSASGISPKEIGAIFGHATGSRLGDQVEVRATARAFRAWTRERDFCAFTSIKGNIGHTEQAAGLASLVAAILSFESGLIPQVRELKTVSTLLGRNNPFVVAKNAIRWTQERKIAGVTSVGMGGTNAHVLIEAPEPTKPPSEVEFHDTQYVLRISAASSTALRRRAEGYLEEIVRRPEDLRHICFSANAGKGRYALSAVAFGTQDTIVACLREFIATGESARMVFGQGNPVALRVHLSDRADIQNLPIATFRKEFESLLSGCSTPPLADERSVAAQIAFLKFLRALGVHAEVELVGPPHLEVVANCAEGLVSLEAAMSSLRSATSEGNRSSWKFVATSSTDGDHTTNLGERWENVCRSLLSFLAVSCSRNDNIRWDHWFESPRFVPLPSYPFDRVAYDLVTVSSAVVPSITRPRVPLPDLQACRNLIERHLRRLVSDATVSFDRDKGLRDLGLTSLLATQLMVELREATGVTFPPTFTFDYPTISALSQAVYRLTRAESEDRVGEGAIDPSLLAELRREIDRSEKLL